MAERRADAAVGLMKDAWIFRGLIALDMVLYVVTVASVIYLVVRGLGGKQVIELRFLPGLWSGDWQFGVIGGVVLFHILFVGLYRWLRPTLLDRIRKGLMALELTLSDDEAGRRGEVANIERDGIRRSIEVGRNIRNLSTPMFVVRFVTGGLAIVVDVAVFLVPRL
ncbi:MAG: hypothetical protein H7841_14625 [Magnetospirillum sp. WYHS-4]